MVRVTHQRRTFILILSSRLVANSSVLVFFLFELRIALLRWDLYLSLCSLSCRLGHITSQRLNVKKHWYDSDIFYGRFQKLYDQWYLCTTLTLLLVGFLEYVNWWRGGAIRPPVRSRELTGRFQWDKRHSIPLIANFPNHYKKSKIGGPGSKNFRKFRDFHRIIKIAITSLFFVRFWWNFVWSYFVNRAFTYIPVFLIFEKS